MGLSPSCPGVVREESLGQCARICGVSFAGGIQAWRGFSHALLAPASAAGVRACYRPCAAGARPRRTVGQVIRGGHAQRRIERAPLDLCLPGPGRAAPLRQRFDVTPCGLAASTLPRSGRQRTGRSRILGASRFPPAHPDTIRRRVVERRYRRISRETYQSSRS